MPQISWGAPSIQSPLDHNLYGDQSAAKIRRMVLEESPQSRASCSEVRSSKLCDVSGNAITKGEFEFSALLADGYSRTRATQVLIERQIAAALAASNVVLVEGLSDQIVLEVLASRRGRDLRADYISVVAIGGATNIGRFANLFGPRGRNVKLAGLYDLAAEPHFERSLEQVGFGRNLDRTKLESLGFYACVTDLEDELIRCLGHAKIESIIESQGELTALRTMQKEPFHRERANEQHIHRFLGVHSGRKYRYARLLAEALDLNYIPPPLDRLLAHV